MTRQTAYLILTRYLANPILITHSLAVEAIMKTLAPRFNGDIEMWGITGLLHDADYEKSKGHPERHGILLFDLEPNSIPSLVEHAIKAHNSTYTKVVPESPMDWALYCCDELTGFITESMHLLLDKKMSSVTAEMVIQNLQKKDFAKGANKQAVYLCEEKLGIPLPEFVTLTLKAMQTIPDVPEKQDPTKSVTSRTQS